MKKKLTNKKLKILIPLLILALISVGYIIHYQKKYKTEIELEYCKEIANEYHWLKLNQFYCSGIYGDEKKVTFRFNLKDISTIENGEDYNKFKEKCIKDINKIKILIEKYLINNPDNKLNGKKISFVFNTIAGDASYMRNYDYLADETEQDNTISQHFLYFEKININDIDDISGFKDAYVLDLAGVNTDDISIYNEFKNLKYLNTYIHDLTEEDKEYLINTFPNCTIICNKETIQKIQQ